MTASSLLWASPMMAFPSSHYVYRAPNQQMPVHTKIAYSARTHTSWEEHMFKPVCRKGRNRSYTTADCMHFTHPSTSRSTEVLAAFWPYWHEKWSNFLGRTCPRLPSSHIIAHTLHSATIFHCQSVLMICIATCVDMYCCVVMVLLLKCSSSPDWWNRVICCLSEWSSSRSKTPDCSKGRYQPST